MEVAENAALRCKSVEIGSDETFRAKNAHVRVALVVGEDNDDVGELGTLRAGGVCAGVRKEERENNGAQSDRLDEVYGVRARASGFSHSRGDRNRTEKSLQFVY